jgi:hypothetical protein
MKSAVALATEVRFSGLSPTRQAFFRGLFSRAANLAKSLRASQSAEKLIRAVGRGFIPGIKTMESAVALATEVCFRGASQEIMPFSASSSAPEGMLAR